MITLSRTSLSFLLCTISFWSLKAQYISGVTTPDKSIPKIMDEKDPEVQFANTITVEDMQKHLGVLASDEYEGRETGQRGNIMASNYIASEMKKSGLKGAGVEGSYFQPVAFTFTSWADADMYINGERFKHLWEFLAFPDQNDNMPALQTDEVIFLGYGIDDPGYSDYKKLKGKLQGKVIMINKGEPMMKDSTTSWVTRSNTLSEWSTDLSKKLVKAKEEGVALVMIIEDDIKGLLGENRRKLLGGGMQLGDKTKDTLLTANHMFVSTNVASAIIGDKQKDIIKSRKCMMKKGKGDPVKFKLDKLIVNLAKKQDLLESRNIIGFVEGSDKKDEYIVVSAHMDHLGKRGDDVYNGADDNGSGTTTVMEIAEAFASASKAGFGPRRSVVFLWVTGEEKGLLGSNYYANNPLFPLEKTMANVNVDMVGRVDPKYEAMGIEDYIYVIGSDRLSTDLHKINEEANQKYAQLVLDYTYNDENDPNQFYYRSDHYNFARNGIPAIFFFNGTHVDYHQISDTVEKINFEKMSKVGKLIFHTTWSLANRSAKIVVDGEVK